MNLNQKIAAALDGGPDHSSLPSDLTIDGGSHRLTLHLTASGPVGLAFDTLDFASTADVSWSPVKVREVGDRIASRVTYLMEPLVVLEHDPVSGDVELRSHAPTARGDQRSYYELRLNSHGALRLSRVAFDEATRRRRPASCQMTREVLERLADDLAASIA